MRDNGAGIPADRISSVFDKNETTTPDDAGTGLGLAIVKTFVEAHGGTVGVESTEGVGSTFRFTLPAATARPMRDGGEATPQLTSQPVPCPLATATGFARRGPYPGSGIPTH